jgi:hypothetical protein
MNLKSSVVIMNCTWHIYIKILSMFTEKTRHSEPYKWSFVRNVLHSLYSGNVIPPDNSLVHHVRNILIYSPYKEIGTSSYNIHLQFLADCCCSCKINIFFGTDASNAGLFEYNFAKAY